MRYGSVCSGIEAATMAWHALGWEPAFFSEIEKFPRAVLEHHYPEVPLHGDFTTIEKNQYGNIDLLVGGTPCQSFSIAGLRGGLDDDRGNLALEFCRLAQRERPRWIVWENVPGVLSSGGGRDFGSILGALAQLGYGLAYRVLDAQYFGVAQRRRRVFVVGYLGDWRRAAAVLFERHGLSGHPAPSREARKDTAAAASTSTYECGGIGSYSESDVSSPLLRSGADKGHGCEALATGGGGLAVNISNGEPRLSEVTGTLDCWSMKGRGSSQQQAVLTRPLFVPDTANAITASLANAATGHNKDENVIAFDAYNQTETDGLSKTVAARSDQDTASCVAYSIMPMNSGKDYKARETEVAQPIMAGGPVGGNQGGDFVVQNPVAFAIQAGALRTNPASGPDGIGVQPEHAYTLEARAEVQAVAFAQNQRDEVRTMHVAGALAAEPGTKQQTYIAFSAKDHGADASHEVAYTTKLHNTASNNAGKLFEERTVGLDANNHPPALLTTSAVRRLTPVECERLQGFPDNFTAIPWRKKEAADCPDGPRYKALGNSMAVPVMRWIGKRIQRIEDMTSLL